MPRATRPIGRLRHFCLALGLTALVPSLALAQFGGAFGGRFANPDDAMANASFVQPERERLRLLSRAADLLEEKRYSEAVKALGEILGSAEDGVLPSQEGEPVRFLKAEAARLISSMPPEGREAYQREYAAQAERALDSSIAAGDVSGIERVAGQFFHTPAGVEATRILATLHLDHGRPLAAALCLERLKEIPEEAAKLEPLLSFKTAVAWYWAGNSQRAQQVLLDLKRRAPDSKLLIGGQQVALFTQDAQALSWLDRTVGMPSSLGLAQSDEWRMYRGNPHRNASNSGGRPLLSPRWRIPLSYEPTVRDAVSHLKQAYQNQGLTSLPGLFPLVVHDGKRDIVLFRTAVNLLAADFVTGKRIWEVPIDEVDDDPLALNSNGESTNAGQMLSALEERLWDDAAYGRLSSDGVNVYAIEDLTSGFDATLRSNRVIIAVNGLRRDSSSRAQNHNRLAAYELKSEGKLKWALGGPPGDEQLPEADTFFLGPPLPVAGRLYVLAETKSQVRLLVIDPQKDPLRGEQLVEWSQAIADLNQDIASSQQGNRLRRLAGVSPSYADGVLVCPTAAGAVAALDLSTRSLRWGYEYKPHLVEHRSRLEALQGSGVGPSDDFDRWLDASALIAEGRVLLAPPDSQELHCLNLADGRKLWTAPRETGLFVACAADGKVLVVGRGSVKALKLSDGSPAWKEEVEVQLPSGAMPSGMGFYHDGRYYLPLTTAEVAAIDLATGHIERSASPRGTVPGNLVCYKGAVVSQSVDYLDRFEQISVQRERVARKLAEKPDDPIALVEHAEILLEDNQLTEALDVLKKAHTLDPEGRGRELLVQSLLEALQEDFKSHRHWLKELEPLVGSPAERAAYDRVLAEGLQGVGETLPALEAYLRIVDRASGEPVLDRLDAGHSVRQDRWLQARLPALREQASMPEREKIDAELQARLEKASAEDSDAALQRFVQFFDGTHQAIHARLLLARRLAARPVKNLLEMESLLMVVAQSPVPEWSREAVARLALLELEANRPRAALPYYERLATTLADQVCLDGLTGKQLVEKLPAESPVSAQLRQTHVWPTGKVEVKSLGGVSAQSRNLLLDMSGSEPLADLQLELIQQTATLSASDALGRPVWNLSLRDNSQRGMYMYLPGLPQARTRGNFLAVSLQNQVFAIDTLGDGKGTPKVLWKRSLTETIAGLATDENNAENQIFMARVLFTGGYAPTMAVLGPVTNRQVCFQRVRSLVALDPLTGETLWVRNNIPAQSMLFGDDEFVFCVPPDSAGRRALVFRAADGELLGEKPIPASEPIAPANQRLTTVGRYVLVNSIEADKRRVRLFDPWHQRTVWEAPPLSPSARSFVWHQQVLALMEPTGRVLLMDLENGRTLIDEQVEAVTQKQPDNTTRTSLAEIYLVGSRDHFILMANSVGQHDIALNNVQTIPYGYTHPMNPRLHGRVYGFDRHTGKKVWSVDVAKQGVLLEQPADLPVLMFAAMASDPNQGGRRALHLNLQFIDKRTGRIVHERNSPSGAFAQFDLVGDPEKKTVDMRTPQTSIRMTFTDQPVPEGDEAAKENGGEKQSSVLRPVFKAFFGAKEARP